ncbi:MAG: 2-oxoglutarate dehydrogenase [Clostridiales bacterium]|nr:2-oxoglutarate dehydrogenase [Candidatus Apopatousia equi]
MFGHRSDGKVVKDIDPMLRVTSAVMPHRYDAMVNYLLEARCDNIDKFIQEEAEKGNKFSYMHICIAAIVRMYAERPGLNRFTMNTRIYERNCIQVSFTVKKALRDGSDETTVKLDFDGTENIYDVKKKIDDAVFANKGEEKTNGTDKFANALISCPPFILKFAMWLIRFLDRHGMVPKWVLKLSPFHTSCFLTNMKSISTNYVYHHLYDMGTTGMFAGLGKEILRPVVADDGKTIEVAKVMQVGVVIDERICDGLYYAKSIKLIKKHLLDPFELKEKYVLPPKKLTPKEQKKLDKQKRKEQKKLEKRKRKEANKTK